MDLPVAPAAARDSRTEPGCYCIPIPREALAQYAGALGFQSTEPAVLSLAQAVATSPGWPPGAAALVARALPSPALAVFGHLDEPAQAWLAAQGHDLGDACARLRYVGYGQAEEDCARLAARLIDHLGEDEARRLHYTAIPRGGILVLGMLAYALRLDPARLEPPRSPDTPLVVVDDCALTGARFGRFLQRCGSSRVVFAHLYSPPALRRAILEREPRVRACVAVHDLREQTPPGSEGEHAGWRERWLARLDGPRYWFGQAEPLCFAWNEPDRSFWNPGGERVEAAWHIVPPELCLRNRPAPDAASIPVQLQPHGTGPLVPADDVVFADLPEQVLVGSIRTGGCVSLRGTAADIWRGIVAHGSRARVVAELAGSYDAGEDAIGADVAGFVVSLLARGLLQERMASIGRR